MSVVYRWKVLRLKASVLCWHLAICYWLLQPAAQAAPPIEISSFTKTSNQWTLTIQSTLTNHMDVFHSTSLTGLPWQITATGLVVNGTIPLNTQTNDRRGYFIIGNGDIDSDVDGLPDAREELVHQTDPHNPDSDSDQMADGWEIRYGFNPKTGNGQDDPDEDAVNNSLEYTQGTNPTNNDSDGDGYGDGMDDSPAVETYRITLQAPQNGAVVYYDIVSVIGTVFPQPADFTCLVNGREANCDDGYFSANVPLADGPCTVQVEAYSASTGVARTTVHIVGDVNPPDVWVLAPSNTDMVTEENIRVVVRADGSNYTGTANGVMFERAGYFYSAWVHLAPGTSGEQGIAVSLTDTRSRTTTVPLWVTFVQSPAYSSNADSDGDGVNNWTDLFPWDGSRSADSDADGRSDNEEIADPDPPQPDAWRFGSLIVTYPPKGYVKK